MIVKRALVVDDSRSARVILSRMLEAAGIQADTAESGEQALDYLKSAHPDVVFMDHLMPGMDGFDALRVMKGNGRTANIPVVMYTSQEGDAYLQQARKAGAIGVLSKTLRPADVSRVLYELQLLPDRRELRGAAERSAPPAYVPAPNLAQRETDADELRKLLQTGIETMSDRLRGEVRATAHQMAAQSPPPPVERSNRGLIWTLIVIALVPSVTLGVLYWRTLNDNRAQLQDANARLGMTITEQQTQIDQLRAEVRRLQGNAPFAASAGEIVVSYVPYGESPFSGARVQRLQLLLDDLHAQNLHGVLKVSSFVGDFCLSGSASSAYKLASPVMPAHNCDLIGNPLEDAQTSATRQSTEFKALLTQEAAGVRIELALEGRKPKVPYPLQTDNPTAREWNIVAARNNRVEFTFTEQPTE